MRNLQASLDFTLPFLGYQPLLIAKQEPAITAANLTKQAMLGAPFAWPWNRSEFTFTTTPAEFGTSDAYTPALQNYTVSVPDFGFIERWTLTDANGDVKEIPNQISLALTSATARPSMAAIQAQDDTGNITVRLNNMPDQAYLVTGQYQREPNPMLSVASTWYPIPDKLSYIYDWGFLAIASLLTQDGRFPIFVQKFTAHLLGAQDGLSEMQRNIFMGNFIDAMRTMERAQTGTSQAIAGRTL
jgi:hypothetical protein